MQRFLTKCIKKLLLSLLIGLCYSSTYGQYNFKLEISSKTLSNKKVYLSIFNNRNFFPIKTDSFLVENGHVIITGEVKQPSNFAAFFVSGKSLSTNFVLDSGKNKVTLELPLDKSKSLTLQSDAKGHYVFADLNNVFLEAVTHYPGPTRVNGYLKIPADLDKQIANDQLKRLEQYPDNFGSLIYLYRMSRTNARPEAAKNNLATLAKFSNDLRNSELGKQLFEEETSLIDNKIAAKAGNEVPIFEVSDLNNVVFSNRSLKGQNYMIVFSATWCGPCQQQLPILKALYKTYQQKGLKVIYFNDDDNITRWKEHVSKNKLTWINVSERVKPSVSKIPRSFGVYSIPTCLIVNKAGVIVYNSDESDPGINHIERFIKSVINN